MEDFPLGILRKYQSLQGTLIFKIHYNNNSKLECTQEIKATVDSGYSLKVGMYKMSFWGLVDGLSGGCSLPMGFLKPPFVQFTGTFLKTKLCYDNYLLIFLLSCQY